ncbi:MAG: hypothetical protein J1F69_05665 [Clostridiales bacterium]|nr:hypothetical protein [Clostridiales bacterium]
MKKTVKSLIVAASVAAVAGIGAVSFAAWSGASNKTHTIESANTGTVVAVGFADGTTSTGTDKALMPIDQPSITSESQTYYYVVTLKTSGTDFTGYKIKATTEAVGSSSVPTGLKYQVTDSAPTTGAEASLDENWKTLSGTLDIVESPADNQTYTVYIVLDSNNASYTANAGKNFKITFELYNS